MLRHPGEAAHAADGGGAVATQAGGGEGRASSRPLPEILGAARTE